MMVTTQSDKDTVITCIQVEVDDYILKPFDRNNIMKKIDKCRAMQ
jgi:DNA-binding NarL/FixJ family response regulator